MLFLNAVLRLRPLFGISNPIRQRFPTPHRTLEIEEGKKDENTNNVLNLFLFQHGTRLNVSTSSEFTLGQFCKLFSETPWLFLFFFLETRDTCGEELGWETNKGSIILCTAEPINEFRDT